MSFPSVSVIMYHYVRDLENSKYPEIKGLDSRLFYNQLKFLQKNFNVVTVEDLIETIEFGKPLKENAVLLTFDDGYSDHYDNVFPALKSFGFQGSFFIPAKAVKENKVLDVNKIHFILAAVMDKKRLINELKYFIEKYRNEYNLQTFNEYFIKLAIANRYDSAEVIFIKRILQVELPENLRTKIVDLLFSMYVNTSESEFAKSLYLSEIQIHEMKRDGMHIGCHGYDHYWWNRLDKVELENEIDLSLSFLSEFGIKKNFWTAAYPYGSHSENVQLMLENKGCKLAFTTEVGNASLTKFERLKLKRFDTNDLPK
jgi:peptidoglycan/xylan/chitin deacetylase (PgdA/CDA1 family)